jgi:phosphate transport system substrate-binding protein
MKQYFKTVIALIMTTALSMPAGARNMPQVRGSDTMVNLVQRMAEVYSEKNPGKFLSVTGGGSGNGLASLRNRTTDIANSSRDIREREIRDMQGKGVNPVGVVIAIDCITIVVNGDNPVDKLTFGQLGAIFRGDVKNWKEVGGADIPITLYGRQSNSGTYVVFRERVLKDNYSDRMYRMNGNSQIVEGIKADKSGIGYVGLGYAQKEPRIKDISLAEEEGAEYIDPNNRSDIEAGRYPLMRPVYQYTDGKPSGDIREFMLFELGPEGQKIVDDMGFIPVSKEYAEYNKQSAGL